jgi:hypothetical protein
MIEEGVEGTLAAALLSPRVGAFLIFAWSHYALSLRFWVLIVLSCVMSVLESYAPVTLKVHTFALRVVLSRGLGVLVFPIRGTCIRASCLAVLGPLVGPLDVLLSICLDWVS